MNILFLLCILLNVNVIYGFLWFKPMQSKIVPNMCLDFVIYNDFYLLSSIVPLVQPYIAEIVIVDGPYKAMIPLLKKTALYYNESSIPAKLKSAITTWQDLGIHVTYIHKEWESEYEKRAAGYDACSSEIVFSLDGDEMIEFKEPVLRKFLADKGKAVGCAATANLVRKNLRFGEVHGNGNLPNKCVLFKKKQISTQQHFAYLWLVGFSRDNLPTANGKLAVDGVARIDHYSILRPHHSMLTKFIFYLWLGKSESILESVVDAKTGYAFLRSNFEYTFCIVPQDLTPLETRFQLPKLEAANVSKCKFGMHLNHVTILAERGGYVLIPTTVEGCDVDIKIAFQHPVHCNVGIVARNSTDLYSIGTFPVDGTVGQSSFHAESGIYVYSAFVTCKVKSGVDSTVVISHVGATNPRPNECVESPTLHTMWG